jgi:hypothetical protein
MEVATPEKHRLAKTINRIICETSCLCAFQFVVVRKLILMTVKPGANGKITADTILVF